MRARFGVTLLAGVALAWTSFAEAKPGTPKRSVPALIAEGRKHVAEGELDKALEAFLEADALAPQGPLKVEIARIQTDLGNFVGALSAYREALAMQGGAGLDRRTQGEAKRQLSELEARTPRVTLKVAAPKGTKVSLSIDGEPAEAGEQPVNPGKHEVEAKAKGFDEWRRTFRLDERESKTVRVDLSSNSYGGIPKWAVWTSWGVTAASLAVGTGFGIMAFQTTDQVLKDYGCQSGKCPATAQADLDVAKFNGNVSTTAFVIGGIGAVAGSVLTVKAFRSGASGRDSDARVAIAPVAGPGFVGVSGRF